VKATELLELLRAFYRDRMSLRQHYAAAAALVGHYDFNNTYQYVIYRSDMHLNWLRDSILDMQGQVEEVPMPELRPSGKKAEIERSVITEDRDLAHNFVENWRPKIEALPNARHKTMLRVILGEVLEQKRFFEQMLAGRTDLLGRRADGAGTGGGVLPTRWVGQT
jgi:hypothetical protein